MASHHSPAAPAGKVSGGRIHGALGVAAEPKTTAPVIECAGALVWRIKDEDLQVLLIHRPRYNDWSWPKGKRDPGEALPCTAVREVKEETGKDIILGIPLPGLQYITLKVTSNGSITGRPTPQKNHTVRWLPVPPSARSTLMKWMTRSGCQSRTPRKH